MSLYQSILSQELWFRRKGESIRKELFYNGKSLGIIAMILHIVETTYTSAKKNNLIIIQIAFQLTYPHSFNTLRGCILLDLFG